MFAETEYSLHLYLNPKETETLLVILSQYPSDYKYKNIAVKIAQAIEKTIEEDK